MTLVPLYPSVLTHEVFHKSIKTAIQMTIKPLGIIAAKKTAEQKPYITMKDLATVQLGGTKPQNVSQLMSKQGGRNYLLPSVPRFSASRKISEFRLMLPVSLLPKPCNTKPKKHSMPCLP